MRGELLDNPYRSTVSAADPVEHSRILARVSMVILIASISTVIGNYATAATPNLSTNTAFMHVLFLLSPFAIWALLQLMARRSAETPRRLTFFFAFVSFVMFCVSFAPWFSSNPFESFVVEQWFLGESGWAQWTWLFCLGLLPLAFASKFVWENLLYRRAIASVMMVAYVHVGFSVWSLCHGMPWTSA